MDHGLDLGIVQEFATALLIGALVGIEREKRKSEEGDIGAGGLRTFILVSQVGAIAGWLARTFNMPWLVIGAVAVVSVPVVASYVLAARVQPKSLSLTTELGGIAVCLLGAMATLGYLELAIGLAVITAAVLAYKQPLHGIVGRIGWDDVFAGLRLLLATFVVLPLLPDRVVDPWGALNPYWLWLLVLLISSLSMIGYVGSRWLGAHRGAAITALSGGLVSSTAVTLSFARRSRDSEEAGMAHALAGGILLAWGIMFGRIVIAVLVVNPELVVRVLFPFTAMGLAAGIVAWVLFRRSAAAGRRSAQAGEEVPLRNPFSLTEAAKFGAFFAVVLVLVKGVERYFPSEGVYVVAALAGITDVDAITLSMAEFAKAGDANIAVTAIVIAAFSNTLVKLGMVAALGGRGIKRPVTIGTVAVLAAGVAGLLLA
jgi:uncharacterized membrane protein (DUF4010 family)